MKRAHGAPGQRHTASHDAVRVVTAPTSRPTSRARHEHQNRPWIVRDERGNRARQERGEADAHALDDRHALDGGVPDRVRDRALITPRAGAVRAWWTFPRAIAGCLRATRTARAAEAGGGPRAPGGGGQRVSSSADEPNEEPDHQGQDDGPIDRQAHPLGKPPGHVAADRTTFRSRGPRAPRATLRRARRPRAPRGAAAGPVRGSAPPGRAALTSRSTLAHSRATASAGSSSPCLRCTSGWRRSARAVSLRWRAAERDSPKVGGRPIRFAPFTVFAFMAVTP
jgi:hypothetical protein